MWRREVEFHGYVRLEYFVTVGAILIVRGNRADRVSLAAHQAFESRVELRRCATGQCANRHVPGFRSMNATMQGPAWLSPSTVSTSQCPMRERLVAPAGRVEMCRSPASRPRLSQDP